MQFHRALAHPDWYPVDHFASLLRDWVERFDARAQADTFKGIPGSPVPLTAREFLAFETGMDYRTIWRFLNPEKGTRCSRTGKIRRNATWIKAETLERFLWAMDMEHLLYIPADEGGFDFLPLSA